MKIVIVDGYAENPGDLSWKGLEELGDVVVYDRTPADKLVERLQGAEIAVINKAVMSREVLSQLPDLKAIAVTATGYNVVDTAAAREKNIDVMNVPVYGTQTVAQFTVGMLLDLCARYEHHDQEVKKGRWSACPDFCFWDSPITELAGKTAGIIGLGHIGQATAKILRALGMKVIALGRTETEEGRSAAEYVTKDELLKRSDVILLHCPLTPETEGIINRDTIAKMKDGVIIINTSRGPLINEQDLADALRSGKVSAAGVDVVSGEPISPENPLLTAPHILITPHIAWAAVEARQRIMDTTVENVKSFLEGKAQNRVN